MLSLQPSVIVFFLIATLICDGETEFQTHHVRTRRSSETATLTVTTVNSTPYTIINHEKTSFTGFIPDVLNEIGRRLNLKMKFKPSTNLKYGRCEADPSGNFDCSTCDGMIGDLFNNTADLAAADITITSSREECVDFIQPFANTGMGVVIVRPGVDPKALEFHFNFNVLKPLDGSVWAVVMLMLIMVWLFLFAMNHFNPYEYGERFKRNLATEEQAEQFKLLGALWFAFTTLQWQGYDRAPRSIASKTVSAFWMIFVTVTLVAYTGSFMNHLFWASSVTGNRPFESPIKSLKDLAENKHGYNYGCLSDGATYQYFQQFADLSNPSTFKKMANYLQKENEEKRLPATEEEGFKLVRNGKYAFIGEADSILYHVQRSPCDLLDTGIRFAQRSYGFALPRDSPHREALHRAVMQMHELGDIAALEEKWFTSDECAKTNSMHGMFRDMLTLYLSEPVRLNIHMFWSPIVIMIVGYVLAVIAAIAEILWYKYRGRYKDSNRQRGQQLANDDEGHI